VKRYKSLAENAVLVCAGNTSLNDRFCDTEGKPGL
jgi:hypothetical protein